MVRQEIQTTPRVTMGVRHIGRLRRRFLTRAELVELGEQRSGLRTKTHVKGRTFNRDHLARRSLG